MQVPLKVSLSLLPSLCLSVSPSISLPSPSFSPYISSLSLSLLSLPSTCVCNMLPTLITRGASFDTLKY